MLKRIAAAMLVMAPGAAWSADLTYVPADAGIMYDTKPAFSWTGFYGGAHLGYGWGDTGGSYSGSLGGFTAGDEIVGFDVDGVLGGVQLGYNWQWNQFVLGAEADLSLSGADGSGLQASLPGPITVDASADIDWVATIRARAGYTVDRFLVYATGGLAFGGASLEVTADGGGFADPAEDDQTHFGWTIGAGLEYAITDTWSAGIEYRYVDLGSESYSDPDVIDGSADLDLAFHALTARVNYHW